MSMNDSAMLFIAAIVAMVAALMLTALALGLFTWLFGPEVSARWRTPHRLLLLAGAAGGGGIAVAVRVAHMMRMPRIAQPRFNGDEEMIAFMGQVLIFLALAMSVMLSVLFLTKLHEKYVTNCLSEAEQQPGAPGFRAWLQPANLFFVLAISTCVYFGWDYSFWGIFVIGTIAILAYPLATTFRKDTAMPDAATADISPERERVMRLVEQGRITGEEGAELLNALATTVPPPAPAEPFTTARKLMLVGAALVLVGFFLPWFEINVNAAVKDITQGIQTGLQSFSQMPGGNMVMQMAPQPSNFSFNLANARIAGGDVGHGLGWFILALGIGAAAVPYMLTGLRRETRRQISIAALGIGAVIALYLLTQGFNSLSFGLPIVLGGYLVEFFAIFTEGRRAPAAAPIPAVA